MPVAIACPSCTGRLKVSEAAAGRRIKCPKCGHVFVFEAAQSIVDEGGATEQREERLTAAPLRQLPRPPDQAAADKEDVRIELGDKEGPPKWKSPSNDGDTQATAEPPSGWGGDITDAAPKTRSIKKKTKKGRSPRRPRSPEDMPLWIWWAGAGGLIVSTFLGLIMMAGLARPRSELEFLSIYLLVSLPVSTVIFFIAMVLTSIFAEALDIGEIPVAVFKAFVLVLITNIISLIPFGGWLALGVWYVGSMTLFGLGFHEARILILVNWVLNLIVRLMLFAAIAGWIMQGN